MSTWKLKVQVTSSIKIGSIEKIMLDKGFIYSVDESNDIKLSDGINLKVR